MTIEMVLRNLDEVVQKLIRMEEYLTAVQQNGTLLYIKALRVMTQATMTALDSESGPFLKMLYSTGR